MVLPRSARREIPRGTPAPPGVPSGAGCSASRREADALQKLRDAGGARRPVRSGRDGPGRLPLRRLLREGEREGPGGARAPPRRAVWPDARRAPRFVPGTGTGGGVGASRPRPRLSARWLLAIADEQGVWFHRPWPGLGRRGDRRGQLCPLSRGDDRRDRAPGPRRPGLDLQERRELRRRPGEYPRRRTLGGRAPHGDAPDDGLGGRLRLAGGHRKRRLRDQWALRPSAFSLHLFATEASADLGSGLTEQPDPAPPRRGATAARG